MSEQAEMKRFEDFVVSSWYFQMKTKLPKSSLEELTKDYIELRMEEDFEKVFPSK